MISDALQIVKDRIAQAAKRSGRNPEDVSLVAVSKQVPAELIVQARQAGQTCFGENKMQEAREKISHLGEQEYQWHFIGHLQKNKVKYLFDGFDLFHSLDSLELAEAIQKEASRRNSSIAALVQVNISGEESKSGVAPEELEKLLIDLSRLDKIKVKGLTTIPPQNPDPEDARKYFAQLRALRDKMESLNIENIQLSDLSMGMTHDYEVAVEEGATLVRVGTAIFGPRANQ